MGTVMEEFFKQTQELRENIDLIAINVVEVEHLHLEILKSTTNDPRKKAALEEIMANIKKISNETMQKLKDIEQQVKAKECTGNSSAEVRIKRIQHTTLSRKLVEVMTAYCETQAVYRDKCKNRIQRQLEIVGKEVNSEQLEEMIEKKNPEIFTQGIIADTQQARQTLDDITARHNDIIKLEADIDEMNDMLLYLAMLLELQGEKVDRIDYSVQDAKECTDQGVVETKDAVRCKAKARRKKFYIIIAVLVLLGVIALIIVASF